MDWIDLVRDRDKWSALVNTVMNLRLPDSCDMYGMLRSGWLLNEVLSTKIIYIII
jgi:hypothetical protein